MTNKTNINEMLPTDNQNTSTTTSQTTSGSKDGATVNIKKKDIATDPNLVKNLSKSGKVNINVIEENSPEAIIEPQDDTTIKYLSNVKDVKTGKVSQPFTIADKKYQMVRGIKPSKEIVMAVFCHDELNENGENIIHPMEHFEKNIVQPMMEKEAMIQQEAMFGNDIEVEKPKLETKKFNFRDEDDSLNLSQTKHYLVNPKTGKFRRFKTVQELAAAQMNEDEKYMNLREFKRYFENKIFGVQKKNINETDPTELSADNTNVDSLKTDTKKLVGLIKQRFEVPLSKLDKEIEKVQFLASMAEILGLDITKLPTLISSLKTIVKTPNQPVSERKIITKAEINESLTQVAKDLK